MAATPPSSFWIDQKYETVRLLGKGGGGQAFLAKKGKDLVAVKLVNLGFGKDPQTTIQKFKREFLTLKKLSHPHIGKVYDFGFDPKRKQYYFVGEFIEGEDIRKACADLKPQAIEKLFVQALQALHYMHTYGGAGLRHNDIKTANMLVTREKGALSVKLIDFGLSNFSLLDVRGGTASYMSPEQIALTFPEMTGGKKYPKPDLKTDLYSLGVAWYLCLTGTNPFFVGNDSDATLKKHFGPLPPPPSSLRPEIPKYLDTVILKLLQLDPNGRFENAAEVIQTLNYLGQKNHPVIPLAFRKFYLPKGEWIGQKESWAVLKDKWEHVSKDKFAEPQLVWVVGHKGQGKTALLEHLKNHVQSLEGRAALLANRDEESLEAWYSDVQQSVQTPAKPLLIAIDDFYNEHPAAPFVEELFQKMEYLKRWDASEPTRWLLVFSRNEAPSASPPIAAATLFLRNFNEEELGELIRKISPSQRMEPPKALIQKLKNHTDGNPMLVTKMLEMLGERGILWNDAGHWHPALFEGIERELGDLPIPQEMETTLGEDWQSAAPDEKQVLEWIACHPKGLTPDEITSLDKKNLSPAVSSLLAKDALAADTRGKLFFKNSFYQRSVYDRLKKPEKTKRHKAIAKLFQKQKRGPHEIAFHQEKFETGSRRMRALETLACFFTETNALREALETRREQWRLSKKPEILLHLLKLLNRLRQWDEVIAMTDGKVSGKGWRTAILREKGMAHLYRQNPALARHCFEKALSLLKNDKKHLKERLILENTIARTFLDERRLDEAIAIYEKTRRIAKSLKKNEAMEVLNNDLGYAYFLRQDRERSIACLEEDLKLFEAAGDPLRRLRCHFLLGGALRRLAKNFDAAVAQYQKAAAAAKDHKDNDWLMRICNGLAGTYLDRAHETAGPKAQNNYTQALKFFEESLALCRHLKKNPNELDLETAVIHLNMGTVHREMGNFGKAADIFKTILSVLESKPNHSAQETSELCETCIALADCFSGEQKFAEMEEPLKKAWRIAEKSRELLEHRLAIQLLWAEAAKAKKDGGEMRKHLDQIKHLQTKYKINPTPMAKKRIEELNR